NEFYLCKPISKEQKAETDRQTDRQADRQTDRQADRQTGRQTERQTDRQTISVGALHAIMIHHNQPGHVLPVSFSVQLACVCVCVCGCSCVVWACVCGVCVVCVWCVCTRLGPSSCTVLVTRPWLTSPMQTPEIWS